MGRRRLADRPRTKAIAHYQRTGVILPGHAGEVAAYIARKANENR